MWFFWVVDFDSINNKRDVYRGKGYMRKFWESLEEHAMKIINFEKKSMIWLIKEDLKSYASEENCNICKNQFEYKHADGKKYRKVEDNCHDTGKPRGTAHSICNLI